MNKLKQTLVFIVFIVVMISCGQVSTEYDENKGSNEIGETEYEEDQKLQQKGYYFEQQKANYTAIFPIQPDTKEKETDNLLIFEAGCLESDYLYKIVAFIPKSKDASIGSPEEYLDVMKASINDQYEIVEENHTTFKTGYAKLIKMKRDSWFIVRLMVVEGVRLFVIDLCSSTDYPSDEFCNQFYDNFSIL